MMSALDAAAALQDAIVPERPASELDDHSDSPSDSDDELQSDASFMDLTIHFHGQPTTLQVPRQTTISNLSTAIQDSLSIEQSKQKIMISPKPGMLKYPFPDTLLEEVVGPRTKITLFGSTNKEITDLNNSISKVSLPLRGGRTARNAKPSKYRDWKKIQEESTYIFHSIKPLPYLSNPERSTRFLERLANDPGIKASMRKHKFSVGLLTEMNPAEHTTQESRTLGLNRNRGEVIELRLRTDAYDGYRDYKVIRKTLCHELSHNVWGEHDRNFWDLTNQIEKEVERADWKHGGHQLTQGEFYNPEDHGEDAEHLDGGGWTGGEFVLGSEGISGNSGLSRRDILARAAMSRFEKQKEIEGEMQKREAEDGKHEDKSSGRV
jgi:WLM domain